MMKAETLLWLILLAAISGLSGTVYHLRLSAVEQRTLDRTATQTALDTLQQAGRLRTITPAPLGLASFTLPYIGEDSVSPGRLKFPDAPSEQLQLFIFFTITDCYTGLADVRYWSELRQEFAGRVRVIGVATGESPERIAYFLDGQGARLPTVFDEQREMFHLLEHFEFPATPVMMLVADDGRLLQLFRMSAATVEGRARIRSLLERHLRRVPTA